MSRLASCLAAFVALVMMLSVIPGSASDYTLDIYGNANMDDTIDEEDITYVEGIIKGTNEATELADANYDGEIDEKDLDLIRKIIAGAEKNLTIVDSYERVVTIKKPVERIVSISIFNFEVLRMFGDIDRIVAIEENAKEKGLYFPEATKLPSIGGYPPDPEAIFKFQPDLVLGATSWTKELYDKLPDNISVVGLDFTSKTPDSFAEETTKLGYILNRRDVAEDYLNNFQNEYLETIMSQTEDLSEDDKPLVYVESSMGKYKAYGDGSGVQTFLEIAGGRNIFEDSLSYFEADPEAVMLRNPDIIIKHLRNGVGYPADDLSIMKETRDEILTRPELADVTAVKEGKVYIIDEGLSYGFDHLIAVAYMAKWLHPELFEELDPQAMHQEFIDEYCPGLNFDVYEHGTFIYPLLTEK